jgi:putative hydrolase of the HAD superfamily
VFEAVVFDLWHTLATWPDDESRVFRDRWATAIGVEPERLDEYWYSDGAYERRETGPIAATIASVHDAFGADHDVDEVVGWRLAMATRALLPGPGVIATLDELRRRGLRLGLISNCTEEVALVWEETPFAGRFDVAVFSATAGCMKPDRRIYEQALADLGVQARAALFVGDGANGELDGARRVGMTPVLFVPEGERPRWHGLEEWADARVSSIPQVLDLVG